MISHLPSGRGQNPAYRLIGFIFFFRLRRRQKAVFVAPVVASYLLENNTFPLSFVFLLVIAWQSVSGLGLFSKKRP
jgi:hypothetical protein